MKRLTPEMLLVDALRGVLGLAPLYQPKGHIRGYEPCGRYRVLESLSQSANPDCERCEGAGYIPGAAAHDGDVKCHCIELKKSA